MLIDNKDRNLFTDANERVGVPDRSQLLRAEPYCERKGEVMSIVPARKTGRTGSRLLDENVIGR